MAAAGIPPERRNDASAVIDSEGVRPRVFVQTVPEGKVTKNCLHLDVRAAPGLVGDERMTALEEEADRLIGLGARRIERFDPAPPLGAGHIVMADPEREEFCLD